MNLNSKGNIMRNAAGCDVSQDTFDVAIIINQESVKISKFDNDLSGFMAFKEMLDKLNDSDIFICMEATGNYYESLADYLGHYYRVSVVNPLKISTYAKSRFNRTKTDKQDSKLIAEYCATAMLEDLPEREKVTEAHYRLKRILSVYEQLKVQKTAEKNRKKTAKDDFAKQIHQDLIEFLAKKMRVVKAEIASILKSETRLTETAARLETIPSVGKLTAAFLANYLLSGQFQTANKFIAFGGLNPQAKKSGTSVNGKEKLTRYGNRRLRGALFMSAMVAYRQNYFPDFIARLKSRKKPTMLILAALMKKIAVIAYHLHKKQQTYDSARYNFA